MCVLLVAKNPTHDISMAILHNRDEFADRPFEKSSVHKSNGKKLIYGTDLVGSGTWLAVSDKGEFSVALNIRTNPNQPKKPKSRGVPPIAVLTNTLGVNQYFDSIVSEDYNPFSLVVGKVGQPTQVYSSLKNLRKKYDQNILTLSNNSIDEEWEKSRRIGSDFEFKVDRLSEDSRFVEFGFDLLESKKLIQEEKLLPTTGWPKEIEKQLSSNFVTIPNTKYQTVISTVVIFKVDGNVRFYEKNHLNGGLINEVSF